MADPISVSIDINAPAERIYELVADLPSMGKWSPEATGGKWLGGVTAATRGARFRGTNRNGVFRWSTVCTITSAEPGRNIEWVTKAVGLLTGALWRYDFKPNSNGGTTVVETTELPIHTAFTSCDAAFEGYEPSSPPSTNRKGALRKSLDTIDENPGAQGGDEVRTYASLVGKHLYRSMYEEFAPFAARLTPEGGPHASTSRCWWWDDPAILDECRRFDAAFEMVTYVYRKDDTALE